MNRLSEQIISDFGGLSAIAELTGAPVSTVAAWQRRISASRLNHLKLAASTNALAIRWDTLEAADPVKAAA